ncbi:MAG: hypothetical protein ACOCW5_00085 [Spirochaetia bacterium]
MKKKADVKRILLIGIPMLLLAIGIKMLDNEARILWFERNGTNYTRAQFYLFSGEKERAFSVKEDEKVRIEWEPELKKGHLLLSVNTLADSIEAEGADTITFTAAEKGQINLQVKGEEARGSFEVRWSVEQ